MIGSKIKLRRKELGLSQTELAKSIGVSKQTLYKYETGIVTNIPSDKIELIAQKLDTSPAYLMGWEQNSDSMYYFKNYIESLGYPIHQDDPEHKPYIITDGEAIRLEYNTLQQVKNRVDTYASLTLNNELAKLKEQELQRRRADNERIAKYMLQAAHNDYENDPEEHEKMMFDLDNLKRPE